MAEVSAADSPDAGLSSSSSSVLLTKNKKGFMIEHLDNYCADFIDYVRAAAKPVTVADFGVAFGYTTKLLLKTGADVIANVSCLQIYSY